jgi:methyl coenzyme M reductase gamma subunit
MELKFVARSRDLSMAFPFPSNNRRSSGTAKVVYPILGTGECGEAYLSQYDPIEEKDEVMNRVDKVMSKIKDGDFVKFIELQDPDSGIHVTTVWNELEWNVYIVNDAGKTIDKL